MKKILLVNTLYFPEKVGGAEVSVQLLAEELVEIGNEVSVLTLKGPSNCKSEEVIGGVSIYRIPLINFYWPFPKKSRAIFKSLSWHIVDSFNIPMLFLVWRKIKEISPDVIHTHNILGISSSIWIVAKLLRIPIYHTTRDYYLLCCRSSMYRDNKVCERICRDCRVLSWPRRKLSNLVNTPVGISRYIYERHRSLGVFDCDQREKIIYNVSGKGASVPAFQVSRIKRIGFIGGLTPSKGIEDFLELARSLLEMGGDYEFLIAGTGEEKYTNSLKEEYSDARIIFLGVVASSFFYKEVDVVVVPSRWNEPFGRVVVEAVSYRVPVIVSGRGGLAELVNHKYIVDVSKFNAKKILDTFEDICSRGYQVKRLVSDCSVDDLYGSPL